MTFVKFTKSAPPGMLQEADFRFGMLNELRKIGTKIKQDLERPTKTWTHKVSFAKRPSLRANNLSITVDTTNEIYATLDQGTSGKKIFPVNAKALRFPRTFSAKTLPGTLQARAGVRKDYIYRPSARWSGIKARDFVGSVETIWKTAFPTELQQALERVSTKTGFDLP